MPGSTHNELEFWLQEKETSGAAFRKGQYEEGLSPN